MNENESDKKLKNKFVHPHSHTNRAFLRANLQKSTVKRLNTKAQHGQPRKKIASKACPTANRHNARVFKPATTPVGSFKDTTKRETAKRSLTMAACSVRSVGYSSKL